MEKRLSDRLQLLQERIGRLPKGNLTVKNIRGRDRLYLQWTEEDGRKSRYIRRTDEAMIRAQVAERKRLEEEYRALMTEVYPVRAYSGGRGARYEGFVPRGFAVLEDGGRGYETNVTTGKALERMVRNVQGRERRACMGILERFLETELPGKVCLLYGLRRTGKTTMVMQAMAELPPEDTAYIKVVTTDDMGMLGRDLRRLEEQGIRYVFIDEVTLMEDFIDSASLLSDVYAMRGLKIVMSGTDSLGFLFAGDDELYDRAVTVHTTFIPFREYARLLGIRDLDEYIRYGGTLQAGETAFDDPAFADESLSFRDDESTRRYIDTAIARNIQHSLACYRKGDHFHHLTELYEAGELTGAVNRVIEDMNHRFLLSVLTKDFVFGTITDRLKVLLDIRDSEERSVKITQDHVRELRSYLAQLDLIRSCSVESIDAEMPQEHVLFTQPGMRYCQVQALVHALMKDRYFVSLGAEQSKEIADLLLEEVKGRLLEEIVFMETLQRLPRGKRVFKLLFPVGEIDMVVVDEEALCCDLYEIKHSGERDPRQYQHLIDEEKCRQIEFRYGRITGRTVLYRGAGGVEGDVQYRNIEEYLMGESESHWKKREHADSMLPGHLSS